METMSTQEFIARYASAMQWASDTGDESSRNELLSLAAGTPLARFAWSVSV